MNKHTIRLHADGHYIEGLEILDTYEGERDKGTKNLVSPGGVEFRTQRGKKLFVTFPEFSFVVPAAEDRIPEDVQLKAAA